MSIYSRPNTEFAPLVIRSIESTQNPVVKKTARLRSSRNWESRIILDGFREIERAASASVSIEQVFALAEHQEWLEQPLFAAADRYVVSNRALEKIAFGQRNEPVATAARPAHSIGRLYKVECFAVIDGIEKPGNLGAIVRSADGAGLDAVIVLDSVSDPFSPNAIRASLGTVFTTQVVVAGFAEYVAWAQQHGVTHFLAKCDGTTLYSDAAFSRPCALVLGSEAQGLGPRWDALPATCVQLPMRGKVDSLNVSATAAVLFYEAMRQLQSSQI